MGILEALILGVIQGLSEFFPISSSGHLLLLPYVYDILGSDLNFSFQDTFFDAVLHSATFVAIIFAYREKIWTIIKNWREKSVLNIIRNVILTSLPAIILAGIFLITGWAEDQSPRLVAVNIIWLGIVLVTIDLLPAKWQKLQRLNDSSELTIKKALLVGVLQSIALLRGVSRSGITFVGGLIAGLNKQDALDYAFLSSLPIFALISIANLGLALVSPQNLTASGLQLATGFISALLVGLAVIFIFRQIINKEGTFLVFGVYRILLGIIILLIV